MLIISIWTTIANWFTPAILFCILNLTIATIYMASSFKSHNNHGDQHNSLGPGQLVRSTSSLIQRVKSISYTSELHHYPFPSETQQHNSPSELVRFPSLLDRVKSFNFSPFQPDPLLQTRPEYYSDHRLTQLQHEEPNNPPGKLFRFPSLLDRVKSFNLSPFQPDPSFQAPTEDEEPNNNNPPGQLVRTPSLLDRVKSFRLSSQKPDPERIKECESGWVTDNRDAPAKIKKSVSEKRLAEKAVVDNEEVDRRRPATMRERKVVDTESFGEDQEVDARADAFINRFKQQLKLQRLDSLLRFKEMLNRGTSSS